VQRKFFEDYYDIQWSAARAPSTRPPAAAAELPRRSITIEHDEQFEALVRSSWIGLVRKKAAEKREALKAR